MQTSGGLHSITFFLLMFALPVQALRVQSRNQATAPENTTFHAGELHPEAPRETLQLGQLVGIWEARQVKRNRDGTWSNDTTRAEWRWYYILDGHAIQDDWIAFTAGSELAPATQAVGTNIRIYNPQEQQWYMAWIDKTSRRLATFTATNENGDVVMTGHNAQGRLIRNTFSNLTQQSFDWTQEWTQDEGQTWFAVARISCRRKR